MFPGSIFKPSVPPQGGHFLHPVLEALEVVSTLGQPASKVRFDAPKHLLKEVDVSFSPPTAVVPQAPLHINLNAPTLQLQSEPPNGPTSAEDSAVAQVFLQLHRPQSP